MHFELVIQDHITISMKVIPSLINAFKQTGHWCEECTVFDG